MAMMKCPECKGKMSTEAGACPKCGYKLTETDKQKASSKKPWYKKWWGIAVIAFISLSIIGVIAGGDSTDNSGSSKLPDYEVSIADIVNEYKANEVAADTKYKGKTIRVSGRIDSVAKDILDTLYITLKQSDQWAIRNVQFFFTKDHNDELSNLKKGQQITIQGTVDGLMGNILVRKSWIVK